MCNQPRQRWIQQRGRGKTMCLAQLIVSFRLFILVANQDALEIRQRLIPR